MSNLHKLEDSKIFYEDRYQKGYMETWPKDKRDRVCEMVKSLPLPREGEALDFGCGNGVFTRVLKEALPRWRVYGCDVSSAAVRNAAAKNPDCVFFTNGEAAFKDKKFDFIFSHHVLEHVFDVQDVASHMIEKSKDASSMLHILPCGNPDSFEWRICNLRTDGINKNMGGRFFFEDEGHIRRLDTPSCSALFSRTGFALALAFYSNQYHGALNWITRSHPFVIFTMFNPFKGKDVRAAARLFYYLAICLLILALRLPVILYERTDRRIFKILLYLLSLLSLPVDAHMVAKSEDEFKKMKTEKNGSEMYLFFTKSK
ncbi:MAG: class I SAM-dependent methyltransferase [bacterium]|nr:class I SAM-dependent methyltransferase [bacterium]